MANRGACTKDEARLRQPVRPLPPRGLQLLFVGSTVHANACGHWHAVCQVRPQGRYRQLARQQVRAGLSASSSDPLQRGGGSAVALV